MRHRVAHRVVRSVVRIWPGVFRHRLAILLAALAFLVGVAFSRGSQAVARDQSPYQAVEQLARVLVLIENHYVRPVDRRAIVEGAIKGMVAELDPHSAYLPPREAREFRNDTQGRFVGIGVEVDARDGLITVIKPMEGSPAERAGIRAGDRIFAVDGWSTRDRPLDVVVKRIRGEPGTKLRLLVQRPGVDKPLEIEVERGEVQVESVVAKRLDGNVAYVGIKQFQRGTHTEFLEAFGKVRLERAEPLEGMILDLRTNPGGLVDEAAAVADELLDGGVIFSTRARGVVVEEVKAKTGGVTISLPLVVLVNEFSASAAELVAGAVQDHRRGLLVGARTFGKGSVQSIVELPDGAALKLTTTLYFTPSGRSIQAEGVLPQIVVRQRTLETGIPISREQDIEGHIPSEHARAIEERRRTTTAEIVVPRDVPSNPVGRGDTALSIGYQILIGDLRTEHALPPPGR